MVQATVNEGMQYGIGILLVLILVVGIGIYLTPALEYDTPDFPTAAEIADLVDLSVPVNTTVSIDNVKINAIYDEIFKDDNIKDIAEQLALDELETKSFKKDLVNFLLSNNITNVTLKDIDYKDIEKIDVRDIDINVNGKDATVTVEFKVYVLNFGDEDEEEKIRINVVFDIENLDEDDDYEDAEVDGNATFELIKFYD